MRTGAIIASHGEVRGRSSTGQPSSEHFRSGVMMSPGQRAQLYRKQVLLFSVLDPDLLSRTKIPPTADKLTIFYSAQPKTFELFPSPLFKRRNTQKPATMTAVLRPLAPCSSFAAASAAPRFTSSAVTAVTRLFRSLPIAKPQLSLVVDGAG